MPRKHLVASQTNKKQQLQAKLWQKLAREIKAAVKVGGPNIEANPRLKAAVDKGLQNNLSRESIQRNISGSSKDPAELSTLEFECYGPNGLQLVISALTDNINRTTSSLRGYLSKFHGEIAKPNSVKIFFDNRGDIIVYKDNHSIDGLMELTMSYEIVDILEHEDAFEILTSPADFYKVKDLLTNSGYRLFEGEVKLISQNKITSLDEDTKVRLEKLLTLCDEDEDIQWVVTNYEEA
ncbi:MAG: YebC/PmpR family DNA-binding transcriptional regulator [Mycoplasmataceae bacterium]|jgi:YebC/PmpR family DNA-binding regulatory protein|nr:YebC/PmpR family DNA-binding transcriptional regulator [Mycoplasmataceae bacterium]